MSGRQSKTVLSSLLSPEDKQVVDRAFSLSNRAKCCLVCGQEFETLWMASDCARYLGIPVYTFMRLPLPFIDLSIAPVRLKPGDTRGASYTQPRKWRRWRPEIIRRFKTEAEKRGLEAMRA